ncbi:MAG: RecQ family ATP-dependent DNA helicase [Caldilineaceae bacterium]|nr:RecQ family ATP-dependent DNA helicase [Caldilineaceae bacterium]
MSERASTSQENSFLAQMQISPSLLGALPPNLRDQLLEYVHQWTAPAEQLALIEMLRQAHGSLLFLLDYQAAAYYQQGDFEQVLMTVERRQRRSTTLHSQMMEARALLALGHEDHARDVIADISQAFARNALAVSTAAELYTQLGQFDTAKSLLEEFLVRRTSDIQATLTMARIAHLADQKALRDAYLQRLGVGIPPGVTVEQLRHLLALYAVTSNNESARAVETELQRRQAADLTALRQAFAPFTDDDLPAAEIEIRYHRHNGPEAIAVNREEQRSIQLATVRHFGFGTLRSGQIETIATVLRHESILTVMPTGAGKSLCYQLPAMMLPRMTLVISPLIALMKDQVESLPTAARAQATFINSTLTEEELARRMEAVAAGQYKLIYAAPERLRQREFLRALRHAGVDLFVIDEAHCVSLWGHDFRPDYLFIQEARLELGAPTTLAMTATAPPRIRDEILNYISNEGEDTATPLPRPRVMAMDIFRNNLHLSSIQFHNEEEKLEALTQFVQETPGSGIVYVNSRHKSEQLAYQLRQAGIAAEAYHAGLSDRGAVQDRFMNESTRVVVATIAFGMGIDKANIRFIVHFHPSRSLAAYYQEVGRAGRDGKPSQGVLFYSNNDWSNLRRWAKSDEYSIDFLHKVYAAIAAQLDMTAAAQASESAGLPADNQQTDATAPQRLIGPVDIRRLQQVLNTDETTVRVAVSILERADLIDRSFDSPQDLTISLAAKLKAAAEKDRSFTYLRQGLALRPGQSATFKAADIANFMGWPLENVESGLLDWQEKGYLKIKGGRRAMLIELPPQPSTMDQRLQHLLDQSAVMAQRRIDDVIGYATAESCRHGYISAHFGSPPRNRCEVCDNCTGVKPKLPERAALSHLAPDDADIEPMIMDCLISLPKPVGRSGLARILAGSLRAPVTADKARHFGALKALGESNITNYIDDLLEDSRLRQYERQGYSVLAPTTRGRTEADLWLAEHPELAAYAEAQPTEESPESEELPTEGDKYTALQKALWLWRRRCAAEQGQPPYVIMSNELMLRIAETRPQSEEELAVLPGMGAQRLQHYGPTILDLIKLNPLQNGDETLLQTQRTVQAETVATVKQQILEKAPTVSAAVEKKIFMKLQELRQKKAITGRMKPYEVAGNTLLKSIAQRAPTTQDQLEGLLGFRSSAFKEDGERILAIIQDALGAAK